MLNCLSLMGPIYLDLCSGWGLMGSIVCPVYFYLWIKGGSYQGRGPPTCPCPLLLLILSHIVPECCIPHISNQLSLPTCRPQEFIFFSSVYTIFFWLGILIFGFRERRFAWYRRGKGQGWTHFWITSVLWLPQLLFWSQGRNFPLKWTPHHTTTI